MADAERRPRRAAANRSNTAKDRIEAAKRKRQDGTLVKDEAPVYDTLNDDEYAQLVAKRRQAGAHSDVQHSLMTGLWEDAPFRPHFYAVMSVVRLCQSATCAPVHMLMEDRRETQQRDAPISVALRRCSLV